MIRSKIIEESDQKNKLISIISLAPFFFDCDPVFFLQKDTDPILSRKMLPDDKTNPSLVVIMSIDPVEFSRVPPKKLNCQKRLEWQSARLPQNHTFLDYRALGRVLNCSMLPTIYLFLIGIYNSIYGLRGASYTKIMISCFLTPTPELTYFSCQMLWLSLYY